MSFGEEAVTTDPTDVTATEESLLRGILRKLGLGLGLDQTANGVRVGAKDSAGNVVFPDDFNKTLTYNGDGTVNTISFTDAVNTWTQTFAYTNGKVTTDPRWVRT